MQSTYLYSSLYRVDKLIAALSGLIPTSMFGCSRAREVDSPNLGASVRIFYSAGLLEDSRLY